MFYPGFSHKNREKIDLHVHTTASDGCYSPQEIREIAQKRKIKYLAFTDHDTTAGLSHCSVEVKEDSVQVIQGIELSTDLYNQEIHILGYFIDPGNKKLQDKLMLLRQSRAERADKIVNKLQNIGFEIRIGDVKRLAGSTASLGRPHVALALMEKGYVQSIAEAFQKYLSVGCPGYVGRMRITPFEAIELIEGANGVPVLAHPGIGFPAEALPSLIEAGLKGIEVYYPLHTAAQQEEYLTWAREYDLVVTGGSDFHGHEQSEWQFLGEMPVPAETIPRLKRLAHKQL